MSKKIFNLVDESFAHDSYSVAGRDSEHIVWERNNHLKGAPVFLSHNKMSLIDKVTVPHDICYGLVFESQSIDPTCYREIEKHIPKFKNVFTHSSTFLKKYPNCKWIPGGGVWIGGRPGNIYSEGNIAVYEKTKLCSMVSSNKTMCKLHGERLEIIEALKDNTKVDTFLVTNDGEWVSPFNSLKDYMFSIVIENFVDELFFTEKLLNCFATGTIPIYLGATNIGSIFDIDGIVQFNTKEELYSIIDTLNVELYRDRVKSVFNNFLKIQSFKSIEDFIYLNYFGN